MRPRPSQLHPRINDNIGQVDRQIHENVEARQDEDDALDSGVVPAQHRINQEPAYARYRKHGFRDDSTADQHCEPGTYGGHDRQ